MPRYNASNSSARFSLTFEFDDKNLTLKHGNTDTIFNELHKKAGLVFGVFMTVAGLDAQQD